VDIDFLTVAGFNRVVLNVNYTASSGHTIYVELYNYVTTVWDVIGTYTGLGAYYAFALQVIDSTPYISSGRAQLKLYHSNAGNAGHETSIDYAALELSSQGPQGPKGSTGATGSTGSGVASGGSTGYVLIKNSGTNYDTAWTNSLTSFANISLTGNISSGNANLGNLVVANYFSGDGSLLTGITAGSASTATTVTGAAQSNITSVGTLTSLTVGPNSSIILSGTSGYLKANSIQGTDGTAAIYPYYGSVSGSVGIITDLTVGTSGTGNISVAGNITGTSSDLLITAATNSNIALLASGTGRVSLDGMRWPASDGTANYVLKTDGSNNLSWTAMSGGSGSGANIVDDTTTSATYYPLWANATSGSLSDAYISSTKLQFNPSTGQLTVQDLNSLSDETLKEDIKSIDDPFSIINNLSGVGFNWIDNGRKSYGLLAQAVEKVIPDLVSNNAQGSKTVNYIPIIAFLIEAVKRQQRDIEELKKDKYS
jgi:hypothetical protein